MMLCDGSLFRRFGQLVCIGVLLKLDAFAVGERPNVRHLFKWFSGRLKNAVVSVKVLAKVLITKK
ncbi:MAG: hypothetical protein M3R14_13355 [Acidobacteriota bacterium]|nr:hypothetical protein [Acidobacteriota bacterium]